MYIQTVNVLNDYWDLLVKTNPIQYENYPILVLLLITTTLSSCHLGVVFSASYDG